MTATLNSGPDALNALAWTLTHFIWQGALLASLCAVALVSLRKATPNLRYFVALGALTLMLLAPVLTFSWLYAASTSEITHWALPSEAPRSDWRDALASWAVVLWLVGVLLFTTRLVGGFVRIQVVKRKALRTPHAEWQELVGRLSERLRLDTLVRVVETAATSVPTVIGWLRPVILMPACAVTGLTRQQVEIVLAHELAHIRRHDYLVNLLQSGVETLLFYHPGVWWVSGRIREEREYCCDDLAIQVTGDPLSYARALTQLETVRSDALSLCPTAIGGSLMNRVIRLVGPDARYSRRGAAWGPLLGALGAAGISAGVSVPMLQTAAAPPATSENCVVWTTECPPGAGASTCVVTCNDGETTCEVACCFVICADGEEATEGMPQSGLMQLISLAWQPETPDGECAEEATVEWVLDLESESGDGSLWALTTLATVTLDGDGQPVALGLTPAISDGSVAGCLVMLKAGEPGAAEVTCQPQLVRLAGCAVEAEEPSDNASATDSEE